MSNDPTCYIYIMRKAGDGASGPVKIGITANPASRLSSINTASPFKVSLVCALATPKREIAKALEEAFHRTQAEHRLNGEWFDLPPLKAVVLMELNFYAHLTLSLGMSDEDAREAMRACGLEFQFTEGDPPKLREGVFK